MPDHFVTDIVGHSFDGFPVKTSDDFCVLAGDRRERPRYTAPDGTRKVPGSSPGRPTVPDHADDARELCDGSVFRRQRISIHERSRHLVPRPLSFAPEAGEHTLTATEVAARGRYLHDELVERITKQPVRFMMVAQLAAADDVLDDPSIAWPATRPTVLGMLTLTALALVWTARSRSTR